LLVLIYLIYQTAKFIKWYVTSIAAAQYYANIFKLQRKEEKPRLFEPKNIGCPNKKQYDICLFLKGKNIHQIKTN